MVLEHTLIVVSNGGAIAHLSQEDVVHAGMLVVVATGCHQVRHQLDLVELADGVEVGPDAEEVECLADIGCVSLVMVRDVFVASLYYLNESCERLHIQIVHFTENSSLGKRNHEHADQLILFRVISQREDIHSIRVNLLQFLLPNFTDPKPLIHGHHRQRLANLFLKPVSAHLSLRQRLRLNYRISDVVRAHQREFADPTPLLTLLHNGESFFKLRRVVLLLNDFGLLVCRVQFQRQLTASMLRLL